MNANWLVLDLMTATYISAVCAVFSVVWMQILTKPSAFFGWVPKYYPQRGLISKIFSCQMCLSGWLSMIIMLTYRFTIVAWGFSIGFETYCLMFLYIFLQIVLSFILIAFSGAMGIFFAIIFNKILNS